MPAANEAVDDLPTDQESEHLIEHNPNAEGMDWEDVRNQFTLLSMRDDGPRKVVVCVRGGVAEVAFCPRGVAVEIRDYDSDDGDEADWT